MRMLGLVTYAVLTRRGAKTRPFASNLVDRRGLCARAARDLQKIDTQCRGVDVTVAVLFDASERSKGLLCFKLILYRGLLPAGRLVGKNQVSCVLGIS